MVVVNLRPDTVDATEFVRFDRARVLRVLACSWKAYPERERTLAKGHYRQPARAEGEGAMSDYEHDFYTWTQAQARALRHKNWATLDVDHLAEEIEDLGQSIEHAIESHLERLLLHLLKWRYDPAQDPRRGRRLTIRHARREIAKYVRRNPGLHDYPAHYLADAYHVARDDAPDETGLPQETFPETCPWPIERVLDPEFWPEG